ncbi:cupin domain-containing protein [Nonlabens antarcticus]|uniref:hypothetical protein n=1 Tax=Nonlabens antarcticus TaxID=392714 RepID=UPI001E64D309|nr:hypothetical protein [Nonlabens antarcticus]
MELKEMSDRIKSSALPVTTKIYEKNGINITAIGLARGVELIEHVVPCKVKLLVVKGEIDFNMDGQSSRLGCFESFEIPINIKHSVVGWDEAIFLLIKDTTVRS